jgi:signal transduction histidine kinase
LATDRSQWPGQARQLLNEQVVPHRETVIRVSEDVQALNRQAFVEQQTRLAAVYDAAERRTWQRLGLALGGSLGIALLATLYGARLERRLRLQREKDLQNTSDLQRLSAQLITAQEDERRTIARELHDEVGQVLTAIKMELSVAQRAIDGGGIPGRPLLAAQTITDTALQSVRDLSRLLHPSLLDDLGLPAAARAHTQRFGARHGIRVDLQVHGMDERLEPRLEAAIYRIIQESLTNIARHAGVSTCRIRLTRHGERLQLLVEDEGRGFDPRVRDVTGTRGLGLIGMRERATQLGGRFSLDSEPGRGTRVSVDVPVSRPAAETERRPTSDVLPG